MEALDITYFLTPKVWGEYGFTDVNTDQKKLKPIIKAVQRNRIEPIIGTILYNKLVELIKAGTVTGLYKDVLENHIIPTMIAYCDYKATWHTTYQITNKTTGHNRDENIESNDQNANNDLRSEIIKDAKQYEKKLRAWICDNSNDVPELRNYPVASELRSTMSPSAKNDNNYFDALGVF